MAGIEKAGLEAVGCFVLPVSSWTRDYYDPMAVRIKELERTWTEYPWGQDVLEEARRELRLFEHISDSFSYGFFVMRCD